MKVIRKKDNPNEPAKPAAAAPAKPAAGGGIRIVNRAPPPPVVSQEEVESRKVAQLLGRLTLGEHDRHCDGHTDIDGVVAAAGFSALQANGLLTKLKAEMDDTSNAEGREAALLGFKQLCQSVGRPCEPYVVPLLEHMLERLADKAAPVRDAAMGAAQAVVAILCPHAVELVLPVIFDAMEDSKKWQVKEGALLLLAALTRTAPSQVSACLPAIVPLISERMVDPREQVKAAAAKAGTATFKLVGNRDIEHILDDLLHCVARPAEVPDVVTKLSATTFVQAVEAPALAVMVPLLVKGLRESTAIQRKSCVIITNMSKLVNSPVDAVNFLPKLLPGVEKVARAAADPELRDVASSAMAILEKVAKEGEEASAQPESAKAETAAFLQQLKDTIARSLDVKVDQTTLEYVAAMTTLLFNSRNFEFDEWADAMVPYLKAFLSEEGAESVCRAYMSKAMSQLAEAEEEDHGWEVDEEDADKDELCNCRFSLAYGGKILLNNATLRLIRGRRYGLCGGNGVGKSTLMKAIARGQLDGFPPADELKTVYVEHDIQASLADHRVPDYVAEDPLIKVMGVTRDQVVEALLSVGFSDDLLAKLITEISGGWKMKLALARAMLLRADILLLDEPTNHLDTTNVAWLENYLVTQPTITCMTVSHDSGFLDNVCTDIIHYEKRQLRRYKGNLSEFVKQVPAAKSYYELEAASLKFRFPTPGLLDGISSKEKPICKLTNVSFAYPGAAAPQLTDVNVAARLSSRVAVIGVNGAGKSTLIKIITGEHKSSSGTVWRHPNLRMAYVAQHAFHHLEEHLDTTPLKYMFKRFGLGQDQEDAHKVDRQAEDEEKKKMAEAYWMFDGHPRKFREIVSRRKKKKDFEYECAWQGLASIKFNRWIPRAELVEKGFRKFVTEFDQRLAASALGNDSRPLSKETITKFLQDFGLEPEFGVHSNIRGLSGGQKVKLVLAAAMWNNPHLLIMDEPTNYLDREALGALAGAIKAFDGGVLLISHNSEFTSTCCSETWRVAGGVVDVAREAPPGPVA
uniref:Elongation factor 3 n=1 Tax=Tetradesmus obliquus TaxID=3088 RepID=A0A383W2Z9_TETOB|eukprot:jgi/Sobl393_1/18774/SZX79082.1